MNFQFYFEKLIESSEFKKFINENKDAFFCSAFFIVDTKVKENKQNIDYYVPSTNKMYGFKIDNKVEIIPIENFGENFTPVKIPDNINFDFDKVEKLIEGEMFDKKIKNKVEKILISVQAKDGKNYLLCTVFISSLGILKVRIDLDIMRIIDFEKKSFFDMIKVVKKGD